MDLDADQCYAAVRTRDPRFDGRFFTGVQSTGVFCRPICPARTPRRDRVQFFASAAAAVRAGFRPCRRCRPDRSSSWLDVDGTSELVRRALAAIDRGALDDGGTVDDLAVRLGVSGRHLTRLFNHSVGSSPAEVASARRVLLANQLLLDTSLPMAAVAFAAGFGSVRRFNEAIRATYDRTPTQVRTSRTGRAPSGRGADNGVSITMDLGLRAPGGTTALLNFLAQRELPGIEQVTATTYRREFGDGAVQVDLSSRRPTMTVTAPQVTRLQPLRSRVHHLLDADADLTAIDEHLADGTDAVARLTAELPARRVPGAWDPWETTVRVLLGQQITVAAATGLAAQLIDAHGAFAPPEDLADGRVVDRLGIPSSRRRALRDLGAAVASGELDLGGPTASVRERLAEIAGVGAWTVEMVALRALRDPDAFPSSDLGIRRGMATLGLTPRDIASARPFRAYVAVRLWEVAT